MRCGKDVRYEGDYRSMEGAGIRIMIFKDNQKTDRGLTKKKQSI